VFMRERERVREREKDGSAVSFFWKMESLTNAPIELLTSP